MANEDVIERIKMLISDKKMKQGDFAKLIECDPSNLSKHLNGRLAINDTLINRIVVNLNVSKQWLKYGTDTPYSKDANAVPASTDLSPNSITSAQGTPVYAVDVTAGSKELDQIFTDDNIEGSINIPGIDEDCVIVHVSGDSMSPTISNGDYIAVKKIMNMDEIHWGQIYVVVLKNMRLVKFVRRHPDPSMVILRSDNPHYDDIEVRRSDIQALMLVHNVLHIDKRL